LADWDGIAGGTLLAPSGPAMHLFIILIKSSEFTGYGPNQCILANITSIRQNIPYDDSCILNTGCHPFITQDSYVLYSHARMESETHLRRQVEAGIMIPKDSITDELLELVIQGLRNSRHTKKFLKQLV
jgi:hypothetical protein